MLWIGLGPYLVNLAVGLLAQFSGRRFGVWHHILYALVVLGAVLTAVLHFMPALILTLLALAVFPWAKPRSWQHPTLAVLGLMGYVLAAQG